MPKKLFIAALLGLSSLLGFSVTSPALAEECTETNDCACDNATPDSMNCACGDGTDETYTCSCGYYQPDSYSCACGDGQDDSMNCGEFGNEACGDSRGDSYSCACNDGVDEEYTCGCGDGSPDSMACACGDGQDDTMDCPCCEDQGGNCDDCEPCGTGYCCRDRDVCSGGDNHRTPGGTCTGKEYVCAVSIVNSCVDNDDCDSCDPCDENGGCYDPNQCGGLTQCDYSFSGSSTGCDGITRTATVNMTVFVVGQCPMADFYAAGAQVSIAQQLENMHPADTDGDGTCDCAEGTDECCPLGGVPDPITGLCDCGPGEVRNDDGTCCDPLTETCDNVDVCPNISGQQDTVPSGMVINAYGQCVCDAGTKNCAGVCIPNEECCSATEVCCPPGQEACPDCRPVEECTDECVGYAVAGEYCTEVVSEGGTTQQPWATKYAGNEVGLGALFVGSNGSASFLASQRAVQEDAREDADPATTAYPLYGRVTTLVGGGTCSAQLCAHGQECALYVRAGGGTSATCVDTVCDPCDPAGGCYDLALCECDPDLSVECCEYAPDKGSSLGCVLPRRGLAIEVLPNLINAGDSCFVFWAAQGMASVTVSGETFDSGANYELRNLTAGAAEVPDVQTSSVYKIVGVGTDGKTYEATDLCAINPVINEL